MSEAVQLCRQTLAKAIDAQAKYRLKAAVATAHALVASLAERSPAADGAVTADKSSAQAVGRPIPEVVITEAMDVPGEEVAAQLAGATLAEQVDKEP